MIAESACGIMDQAAAVLGDEGYVLPLLCQPCQPRPLVRLPEGLRCWAVDSGVSHAVTGMEYEAARAAAFMGYSMICDWEDLPVTRESSEPHTALHRSAMARLSFEVTPSLFRSKYDDTASGAMPGAEILRAGQDSSGPFHPVRPK